jgi:hypothetical protein
VDLLRETAVAGVAGAVADRVMGFVAQMAGHFAFEHGLYNPLPERHHQAILAHHGFGIAFKVREQFVEKRFLFLG